MKKVYIKITNCNKPSLLIFLFVLSAIPVFAQNFTGRVVDRTGCPVPYVNVLIRQTADSAFVNGAVTGGDGTFIFKSLPPVPFLLQTSCIGYYGRTIEIRKFPIGDIIIKPNAYELESVKITGERKKALESRQGVLTVHVKNTYLKDEPDIFSLLSKMPGVKTSEGAVTIFGKNNVAIYIDGRKIISENEIYTLDPSKIIKAEIINSPGAEYDADCDGVIKIYTGRKNIGRGLTFTVKEDARFSRGFTNTLSFGAGVSGGKIAQTFDYNYGYARGREQKDIYQVYNYLRRDTNLSVRNDLRKTRYEKHNIFYGILYQPVDGLNIGAQYTGSVNRTTDRIRGIMDFFRNDSPVFNQDIYACDREDRQLHNAGINLDYNISEKINLNVLGDYAYARLKNNNNVAEERAGERKRNLNISDSRYDIYSVNARVKYSLPHIELILGSKLSSMADHSEIAYSEDPLEKDRYKISEKIAAVYLQSAFTTKIVDIKAGLRGEYAVSGMRNNEEGRIKNIYKHIFPYLSVSRSVNQDWDMSLSYRGYIDRPGIYRLDPKYIYNDTLNYTTGNPLLKPETSHQFGFNISYKSLTFDAGYSRTKNKTYLLELQSEDNPDVIISTYGNLKHAVSDLSLSMSYNYDCKYFSAIGTLMVDIPHAKIPYKDGYIIRNKPQWFVQLSSDFYVYKDLNILASYRYTGEGDFIDMRLKSYSCFDIGINYYLFKRAVLLTATLYDAFHKNFSNCWYSDKNTVSTRMYSVPDSRRLGITVRYSWGNNARPVKRSSSNTDERNRL